MTQTQQQTFQALAAAEMRQCFAYCKAQTDAAGKDIKAFFAFLVDDFFATAFAAITRQDMQAFDPQASILDAIWDGRCKLYEDPPFQGVRPLSQAVHARTDALEDFAAYEKVRRDYEEALIAALQQLDGEGVFGNRAESGMVLFAFYVDDHDGNGEGSVLHRSAKALNTPAQVAELIGA